MVRPIAPSFTTQGPAMSEHEAKLTHQAERLVGQTFYGTLLKQMHNSAFKSKLMDGGRGGEAFQPMMDQHLIDHMSHHCGKKLVRTIVKHITRGEHLRAAAGGSVKPASSTGDRGTPGDSGSRQQSSNRKFAYPKSTAGKSAAGSPEERSNVPVGLRA